MTALDFVFMEQATGYTWLVKSFCKWAKEITLTLNYYFRRVHDLLFFAPWRMMKHKSVWGAILCTSHQFLNMACKWKFGHHLWHCHGSCTSCQCRLYRLQAQFSSWFSTYQVCCLHLISVGKTMVGLSRLPFVPSISPQLISSTEHARVSSADGDPCGKFAYFIIAVGHFSSLWISFWYGYLVVGELMPYWTMKEKK